MFTRNKRVFLKSNADTFLVEVWHYFPEGFPVTNYEPDTQMADYWEMSLLQKIMFGIEQFLPYRHPLLLNQELDPPFFILDSEALTLEQYQAVLAVTPPALLSPPLNPGEGLLSKKILIFADDVLDPSRVRF